MEYNEKARIVLQLARDAKDQGNLSKLDALECSFALAEFYKIANPRRAHQLLDNARGVD